MLRISAISGESATGPTGRRGRRPLQTIFDIQRAHDSCAERVKKGRRRGDPWSPADFAEQNLSPQGETRIIFLWKIRKTSFFGGRARRPAPTVFFETGFFDSLRAHESCALFLFFCKWVLYKEMNILYNIFRWKRFQFAESYNYPGKEPCDYDRTVLHRRI